MPKQGSGTSGGTGPEGARTPPLPDLVGVDLHKLRFMDDPALLAAVDEVLRRPELLAETWCGNDTGEGVATAPRHSVPGRALTGRGGA